MINWLRSFFLTTECFYCKQTVDKKDVFDIKLDTAEGKHILKACPTCAVDINDVLKAIEEVK